MSQAQQTKMRHSQEEWIQLMIMHESGNLTQRQFYVYHQPIYITFGYWWKRPPTDAIMFNKWCCPQWLRRYFAYRDHDHRS